MTLNRNVKRILIGVTGLVIVAGVTLFTIRGSIGRSNAEKLVNYMYTFNSIEDLKARQDKIKGLVTKDAYQFVELNNMEHSLQAYLKLKGKSSKVDIQNVTDDYVIYELDSEAITPGRTFMLMYGTNFLGKLNRIREAEVVDFY